MRADFGNTLVPPDTVPPPGESRRLLFVDDDPLMIRAFGRAVRDTDLRPDFASSGGEALALAQRQEYPVVVTDLRMPGIDGVTLIEQISMMHPTTTFLLVAADPDLQLYRTSRADAAVVSVMAKPWHVEELLSTLARAFDLHRKRLAVHGSEAPSTPLSVLVVEDDEATAFLMLEYLTDAGGLDAHHVASLHDALGLLHMRGFDVIVTDLRLPDARGLDSVMRLRGNAPDAAIVVCSGMDDEALALQMIQVGAHDYLTKDDLSRDTLQRTFRFALQRKRAEQRLLRLAHCDPLTGLANRASFLGQLDQTLARCRRYHSRLAVVFLDLDGFKAVNDTYGHDAGDMLLQEVAARLHSTVRPYDTVARLGGDEFAILLPDPDAVDTIRKVGERLVEAVDRPIRIGDKDAHVTVSIGIAVYPDTTDGGPELLRCADQAMYESKRSGRNRVSFAPRSAVADAPG